MQVICLTSRTQLLKGFSRASALNLSPYLFCSAAKRYRSRLPAGRNIDGNFISANFVQIVGLLNAANLTRYQERKVSK